MKVVITGGGGFLGQYLAKEILSKGCLRSKSSTEKVTEMVLADIAMRRIFAPISQLFCRPQHQQPHSLVAALTLNLDTGTPAPIELRQRQQDVVCNHLFYLYLFWLGGAEATATFLTLDTYLTFMMGGYRQAHSLDSFNR